MISLRKKHLLSLILVLFLLITLSEAGFAQQPSDSKVPLEQKLVKNVIMMIPDGMGLPHVTLARWYKGGELLTMDQIACGLVRTYASDSAMP